ncbi:Hypothetical protein Minf_1749 [Methylacidiphilum infernorum V4]|uniref:Uncharacterized protein n=1 Tax=Methylacidiphilum infernorum (isolate V4) TaxID=481448 RepID=B3DX94_METI4|nr:Hypothetical protein Minf_1749 [Methylacidiphilum infernorum V4]
MGSDHPLKFIENHVIPLNLPWDEGKIWGFYKIA